MTNQNEYLVFQESEKQILQICKEIFKDNKQFSKDKIISMARRRTDLTSEGIITALDQLIQKKYLVTNSYLLKEAILQNTTRRRIFNEILKHYCMSAVDLKRSLDLPNNAISWNLKILLKFGYIVSYQIGKRIIFCSKSIDEKLAKASFILHSNEKLFSIIKVLTSQKSTVKDLVENVEISHSSLSYYINVLQQHEMLENIDENDEKYISIGNEYLNIFKMLLTEISGSINDSKIESEIISEIPNGTKYCVIHKEKIDGEIKNCMKCDSSYCTESMEIILGYKGLCLICGNKLII